MVLYLIWLPTLIELDRQNVEDFALSALDPKARKIKRKLFYSLSEQDPKKLFLLTNI